MDILIRSGVRAGVPVLELWQPALQGRPLVVVQHGYTGRKEFMLPQAYNLAAHGFFTVVPDAWQHGERAPGTALYTPAPHTLAPEGYGHGPSAVGPDLFACVANSALSMDDLLAAYDGDARADADRAGLAGYSMGGMICFYYLTLPQRRVKALCPVIGTPDWASILDMPDTRALCQSMGMVPEGGWDALTAFARRHSPSNVRDIRPLPMLVQNGGADPLIPPQPMLEYIEAIRPLYADPAQLEAHVYPGQGHADTVDMNMKIVAWFRRYL